MNQLADKALTAEQKQEIQSKDTIEQYFEEQE